MKTIFGTYGKVIVVAVAIVALIATVTFTVYGIDGDSGVKGAIASIVSGFMEDAGYDANSNVERNYYSSLTLAVDDVNNETVNTENTVADVSKKGDAVCCAYKVDDTCTVELYKDIDDQVSLLVDKPVKIDLNNHTVSFAEGAYITSTNDLTVVDGELIGTNAGFVLYAPSGNNLTANNVNVTLTADSTNTSNNFAVATKALNNNVDNCNFIVSNESNKSAGGVIISNANSVNKIESSNFDIMTVSGSVRGVQGQGNTILSDNIVQCVSNTKDVNCLYISTKEDVVIDNCKFIAKSGGDTAHASILYGTNSNTVINDGEFIAESDAEGCSVSALQIKNNNVVINGGKFIANGEFGYGIGTTASSSTSSLTINSTEESPVAVFGEQWGISWFIGKININGGTYTSGAHPLYLQDNSTIKNAKIYCTGNEAGAVYLGGSKTNEDAVLNFENCVIGNSEAMSQKGLYTFVSTRNYEGYKTVKEVNITDCDIYQPRSHMFGYHNAYKDGVNLNQTKFNLYGDTKLYEKYDTDLNRWVEYSKEDVANYIDPSWKTILNGADVGNKLVWSPNSVITDGVIVTNNMTEEANVYDYR